MDPRRKLAAYLGLIGLGTGIVAFVVFVWPELRKEWGL